MKRINRKIKKEGKETMKSLPMQNLLYPQTHVKKDKERQYARFLDVFK